MATGRGGTGERSGGYEGRRALRDADWKLVQTGSAAAFQSKELPALTHSMMDNSPQAQVMPMPLIAPTVKAVAQSAMRKGKDEAPARSETMLNSDRAPMPQPIAESPSEVGTLSKDAFESLAVEMADHISRRIQREKERKGQWP